MSGWLTTIAGAALIGVLAAFRAPARPATGPPDDGSLVLTDHAVPGHESQEPPSS